VIEDKKEITCQDTTWLVSDARERELTPEEKRDLLGHIESCELCQGASKQFDVLFRQLKKYFGNENTAD
jgi:hypothetical protein